MKSIYINLWLLLVFTFSVAAQQSEKEIFLKKLIDESENRFYAKTGDTALGRVIKIIVDDYTKREDKKKYITVNPRTVAVYLAQNSLLPIIENENQLTNEEVSYLKNIERMTQATMYISPETDKRILFFRKKNFDVNHYLYSSGVNTLEGEKAYKKKLGALQKLARLNHTGLGEKGAEGKIFILYEFGINFNFRTMIFNKTMNEALVYYTTSYGSRGFYYLRKTNDVWMVVKESTLCNDCLD
jgi:hypothetical protein